MHLRQLKLGHHQGSISLSLYTEFYHMYYWGRAKESGIHGALIFSAREARENFLSAPAVFSLLMRAKEFTWAAKKILAHFAH